MYGVMCGLMYGPISLRVFEVFSLPEYTRMAACDQSSELG